jgi:pimeloyl-ACP methyl ester carboxylesterase
MEMSRIEYPISVGNGASRIVECGSGDCPALLVHGIGSHAGWWDRNLEGLAELGLHVYAVDLPGHGFAAANPGWDLTVHGYRDFLAEVHKSVIGAPACLIGHSLGGHVAAAMALLQPSSVESLILVAPTGITAMGSERLRATQQRQSDVSREAIERKLRFATYRPEIVTQSWIEQDFRINNGPGAPESLSTIAAHLGGYLDNYVVGERLADLVEMIPTLLVWGEEDRSVPITEGRLAHQVLTGARLAVLEGAAHIPHFEVPEAFNAVVATFLSGEQRDVSGATWE